MLRRRETLLWTFVMPVIFFYFIGKHFGRLRPDGRGGSDRGARLRRMLGFSPTEFTRRLEQRNFRVMQKMRIISGRSAFLPSSRIRFWRANR